MISIEPLKCVELAISGTAAATNNVVPGGYYYIMSTVDCFVTTGTAPVATASGNGNFLLLAGIYASVRAVATTENTAKFSAITSGASGTLYVSYTGA
jgi:hypothetical protein